MEGPGLFCCVVFLIVLFCIFYYIIYLIYYYIILLLSPLFHLRSFLFLFWVQKSSCLED